MWTAFFLIFLFSFTMADSGEETVGEKIFRKIGMLKLLIPQNRKCSKLLKLWLLKMLFNVVHEFPSPLIVFYITL